MSLPGRMTRRAFSYWFASLLSLVSAEAYAQRDLKELPIPDPVAERAAMQVADGFEINLFASDPDFSKPIHMNFDSKGRLWVASSQNYPQIEPGAKPTDQIVVLEDTDHDGKADKRTVFADDLLIPTGVLPGDGGVYVANSTELIHLQDTDGDGRSDKKRTILSGFGTEDTHHLLHTLRWGPDGRLYMNQSIYIHSHIETPQGTKRLDGGGIWRFDPTNYDLEILCKGFVNPWGHVIDRFGQSLATDGAYSEGINYVFPDSVFFSSPGAERWIGGLNPGSPKHCSLEQVTGRAMPDEAQNWLITNDFRAHRVCVFQIERQGSGYRSVQLPELIRTNHAAFRPIDVKMGPDGAIYIADWYNPIIQHGEVDFRDARRDRTHGRIWRVTSKGKAPLKQPDYAALDEAALCALLDDSAEWVRQFARMELAKRDATNRKVALSKWIATAPRTHFASLRRLERMWVALCARDPDYAEIAALSRDDDPRIRAAAVRFVGRYASHIPTALELLKQAVSDEDGQVVLEGVCALEEIGTMPALEIMLTAASRPNPDQFLKFALWNAAKKMELVWSPALQSGSWPPARDANVLRVLADAGSQGSITKPLLEQLKSGKLAEDATLQITGLIAERAQPDAMSSLVEWITQSEQAGDTARRQTYLETVARIASARKAGADRAGELITGALARASNSDSGASDKYRAVLTELAGQWQVTDAVPHILRRLESTDDVPEVEILRRMLPALALINQPTARDAVRRFAISENKHVAKRAAAIAALSNFDVDAAAEQTLQLLASIDSENLANGKFAVEALLARKGGVEAITKALKKTSDQSWSAGGARTLLSALRSTQGVEPSFIESVAQTIHADSFAWKWSDEFAKKMLDMAAKQGDAARGEAIYRRSTLQCVRCHSIGPGGGAIGPNLVSLGGSSTPEYILQSIIDPAAKVKEGFQTLVVLMDDGRVINGLQKGRSERQIQVLSADGKEHTLSMDSVESITNGQSLMPPGLVDGLTEQELADLTRFLMALSREPAYTIDTAQRVRNWQALQWSQETNHLLNRTSLDSAAGPAKDLKWAGVTTTVAGSLPMSELPVFQPHRDLPTYSIVAFDVECKQGGNVRLLLSPKPSAVAVWTDGRPTPTPIAAEGIKLSEGSHRFVVGIKVQEIGPVFGCELKTDQPGDAVIELKAMQ